MTTLIEAAKLLKNRKKKIDATLKPKPKKTPKATGAAGSGKAKNKQFAKDKSALDKMSLKDIEKLRAKLIAAKKKKAK